MRLIRGRREKPKTDVQIFAEKFKDIKDNFLRQIDDSRYSLFALKADDGTFMWECNFCGVWIASHPDIHVVINEITQHHYKQVAAEKTMNATV